jgi:Xaa-Pro dipeptidase
MSNIATDQKPEGAFRYFSDEEFYARWRRVREKMADTRLNACIITNPENIYYLTGLHHQGYFAYTSLILPVDKEPILISRAMEKAIVRDMLVPGVIHCPYSDGVPLLPAAVNPHEDLMLGGAAEDGEVRGLNPWSIPSLGLSVQTGDGAELKDYTEPAKVTCRALKQLGLSSACVAFEKASSFLPYKIAEGFVTEMPDIRWADGSDIVNGCRIVQSETELECTRKAAQISDAMLMAGVAAAGAGIAKKDVVATIYQVMLQRGSTYPAYVPLVRSTRTLEHEHGTWEDSVLTNEDLLFMEMSGCVWRYHAPIGRLVHVGEVPAHAEKVHKVCTGALAAAADAIKPGVTADYVYRAWQKCVDEAGLSHYRRHHCGYIVGLGFPPCWSGSGVPQSLRQGSDMVIREGMVFLLMSWLLRTGQGDAFICDTIRVTEDGCEFLTKAPHDLIAR